MAYHSPYHILDVLQIEPELLDQQNIGRLRKKILTDFQLAEGYTLRYGNKDYTKDDILKLIADLQNVNGKEAHLYIFRDTELLDFCENPEKAMNPVGKIGDIFKQTERDELLVGFLAEAELEHLRYVLRRHHYNAAFPVQGLMQHAGENYQHLFFEIVNRHATAITNQLDDSDEPQLRSEFRNGSYAWIAESTWADFFNSLGEGYAELRDEIASTMINFGVAFQHINRRMMYRMSTQMLRLNCDGKLNALIKSNHAVYEQKKNGLKVGGFGFSHALAFVWLILLLVRFANSCTKNDFEPPKYEYLRVKQRSDELQRLQHWQDSIGSLQLLDSIQTLKPEKYLPPPK